MNNQTIERGRVARTITAPASKSYAQRAIAAALLASGESTLTNLGLSNDARAALDIARNLGAKITHEGDTYYIRGGLCPQTHLLNVGESGLSARLFIPIASLFQEPITLQGEGSILGRPIGMMEEPLQQLKVRAKTHDGFLPIEVKGPLRGGEITVDGSLSSQFITGLLMALPLASEESTLRVKRLKSRPYIDMTLDLLQAFGIEVKNLNYEEFYIEGGQSYTPTQYNIEGDWSGASCLLVAGATAGEVTIENLNPTSLQADVAIVEALSRAGAEVITTDHTVTVRHTRTLHGFDFDATDCPDLFPALVTLAANCTGETILKGAHRLIHKESNRARTLADIFATMGIQIDMKSEDIMRIIGGEIQTATVSSHNDHRIAMAAAVAGLNSTGAVTIQHPEAVEKSYPDFWKDLERLRA